MQPTLNHRPAEGGPGFRPPPRRPHDTRLVQDHLLGFVAALTAADVLALIGLLGVVALRHAPERDTSGSVHLAAAVIVLLVTPVVWRRLGLYRMVGSWTLASAVTAGAAGAGSLVLIGATVIVVLDVGDVSRPLLLGALAATGAWVTASRAVTGIVLRRRQADPRWRRRVLLVGGDVEGARFVSVVHDSPDLGMTLIGYVGRDIPGATDERRLGDLADLADILATEIVDDVVVCLPFTEWNLVRDCVAVAREQGKTIRMPLWVAEDLGCGTRVDDVVGAPLLSLTTTPDDVIQVGVKRVIDVVIAAITVVCCLPVLAAAAVAVKVGDGGPILFAQTRVGLHGRPFRLLKFRTMVVDAEARLAEVAHLNERDGVAFKATNDPRVTPIGRWLRRLSIDELPQLLNVLKGEMSLVGPRPAMPHEVSMYDLRHRRRLSVKPGVTGLWQVSARQDGDFEAWVELDLAYIDTWSLASDVRILCRTVPAVLRGTGV
ncbi:sugar transferase [Euzebya sp.]|uniref:sugar transferase n=1 Tax=Euzebya sp. TaxID=1971409 RepID=UPI003515224F